MSTVSNNAAWYFRESRMMKAGCYYKMPINTSETMFFTYYATLDFYSKPIFFHQKRINRTSRCSIIQQFRIFTSFITDLSYCLCLFSLLLYISHTDQFLFTVSSCTALYVTNCSSGTPVEQVGDVHECISIHPILFSCASNIFFQSSPNFSFRVPVNRNHYRWSKEKSPQKTKTKSMSHKNDLSPYPYQHHTDVNKTVTIAGRFLYWIVVRR